MSKWMRIWSRLWLRERRGDLEERMDRTDVSEAMLWRTYRGFERINRWFAGNRRVYTRVVRPYLRNLSSPGTVVDVGCGGGDFCRNLEQWLCEDELEARVIGLDPDERAIRFARARAPASSVRFETSSLQAYIQSGSTCDVLFSNHLLHHLSPSSLEALFRECDQACRGLVVMNDLRRSRWSWLFFSVVTAVGFSGSFIRTDGLRSIARAYRPRELAQLVPDHWRVVPVFPFRLWAMTVPNTPPYPDRAASSS